MKKKIIAGLVASGLMFGFGGVAGALVYHVADAAEAKKVEVDEKYNSYLENRDSLIKNDTSSMTQSEIDRLNKAVDDYFNEKAGQDYQKHLNEKSQEITNETDRHIEELKGYIDSLFGS